MRATSDERHKHTSTKHQCRDFERAFHPPDPTRTQWVRAEQGCQDQLNRVVVTDYHERVHAGARPQSLREKEARKPG